MQNRHNDNPYPLKPVTRTDLARYLQHSLSRIQRLVLVLYYYEELTYEEIAFVLNCSASAVHTTHEQVLKNIKAHFSNPTPSLLTRHGQRPRFLAFWDIFQYILPRQTRLRVYTPAHLELAYEYITTFAAHNGKAARIWLHCCFIFRTLLLLLDCVQAILTDRVAILIRRHLFPHRAPMREHHLGEPPPPRAS